MMGVIELCNDADEWQKSTIMRSLQFVCLQGLLGHAPVVIAVTTRVISVTTGVSALNSSLIAFWLPLEMSM
jgi:hypothetical protein